eukprot:CAMPEP_0202713944 /NCGR_PEP_ID=MMETSP1385-20130828/61803_1 /ASSEMBLY_ACC=CAM_ASM_000861 /TAXON_ID=933848 /ORGANISM="Elphidium margaritaceum" /LENGTH=232 /DNA_ID=CAMNT_0049374499 /DNA_START=44 /DNA_END=742 /DNA_ORIENTATION=+
MAISLFAAPSNCADQKTYALQTPFRDRILHFLFNMDDSDTVKDDENLSECQQCAPSQNDKPEETDSELECACIDDACSHHLKLIFDEIDRKYDATYATNSSTSADSQTVAYQLNNQQLVNCELYSPELDCSITAPPNPFGKRHLSDHVSFGIPISVPKKEADFLLVSVDGDYDSEESVCTYICSEDDEDDETDFFKCPSLDLLCTYNTSGNALYLQPCSPIILDEDSDYELL